MGGRQVGLGLPGRDVRRCVQRLTDPANLAQMSVQAVGAGHASADSADRLVRDGVSPGSEVVQAYLRAILPTEENDLIIGSRFRDLAQVDDTLVHRYASDKRRTDAPHK